MIAETSSPTIAQLAAATNVPSDNFYAESSCAAWVLAMELRNDSRGLAVQRALLQRLGVSGSFADGSGLSRGNRVARRWWCVCWIG